MNSLMNGESAERMIRDYWEKAIEGWKKIIEAHARPPSKRRRRPLHGGDNAGGQG